MFNAKGLLFDLDGTLVDSFPDIAHCTNLMLAELGRPTAPIEEIRAWVGNGSPTLVKRALTGEIDGEPEAALFEAGFARLMALYPENIWNHSRLYAGVIETLEKFTALGFQMACVTNKPGVPTQLLLEAAGLARFFECTVAGDTLAVNKPDPAPLYHAAEQMGLMASDCVMIGDSVSDIRAGRGAAMPVLCLTYGYNQGLNLSRFAPNVLVDNFAELASLVSFAN